MLFINMHKIYDADVYYGFFIELKDLIPFMDKDWQEEYNDMLKIENEIKRANEKYRLVDDYLAGTTPFNIDHIVFDAQILPIDMYKFYFIDYDKTDVVVVGIHHEHLKNPSVLDLMSPFQFRIQDRLSLMYSKSPVFKYIEQLFKGKSLQDQQVIVLFEE